MKILITAPNLDINRNVSGISSLVRLILEKNIDNKYFHYKLGQSDNEKYFIKKIFTSLQQIFFFPIFLIKSNVDLVHLNIPLNSKGILREFIIANWCRLFFTKYIAHLHGGENLMKKIENPLIFNMARFILVNSKNIIVLSELEKNALQENFLLKNSDIDILYNCVDTSRHSFEKKKIEPIFLFMGRLHESKGIEDIYEAFKILKGRFSFKLIFCGAGPLEEFVINKFGSFFGNQFEFRGIVSNDRKEKVISESSFFLLPSRYGEGLPIALLETMSAGLIPITTDDASMKFVIQHESNGIIVKKYSPCDIADKITALLGNESLLENLSANAANTVHQNFDISKYIFKLNSLYQKSAM